ncbi:hypothetical protein [Nostoc sp. NOS(2021)]|uniref:hypothetical protein n=1 Tax=Nostoc sp. NOS(2021) TaxID=2815407 RepID=UPI0025CEAE52|nr:hypothetical protein [Nostoc sp. NOS(2021)]
MTQQYLLTYITLVISNDKPLSSSRQTTNKYFTTQSKQGVILNYAKRYYYFVKLVLKVCSKDFSSYYQLAYPSIST